ncbi:hypothetical protein D2V17_13935 [Aurantiacibacter xanthus]|uniref:Uncharacterized protein n=1 Tax=Aurantiacibacter xanthus TaxID=1784712 RepID=A0A3A1P2G8_9SPHN|nr:hypothetical protein [Aurantiacibacter xanthus]RIV83280.1 hypothetical protein D2V17_13935 [Aurantiacibacter xanthus]
MDRYSLHISPAPTTGESPMTFDVPDLRTALIVTDIIMTSGVAEVWQEDRRLASVRRANRERLPFWHVG